MNLLIAFEGQDASGKATHSQMLATRMMREANNPTRVIDFPAYKNTVTGPAILANLTQESHPDPKANALVLQCLMTVNRLELAGTIREELRAGNSVVLDRYWGSAMAYGMADGLDPLFIKTIHEGLPQPDLWLLLDIPPEESSRRRPERRDRYEKQPGLMAQVSKNYKAWFEENSASGRWVVIDGTGPAAAVHARVWAAVVKQFKAMWPSAEKSDGR